MTNHLVIPHGGSMTNLMANSERAESIIAGAGKLLSWNLTLRQVLLVELLLNGGLTPLTGFMSKVECEQVKRDLHLASGLFWPEPVALEVTEEFAGKLKPGDTICLREGEGVMLAVMHLTDIWQANVDGGNSDVWNLGGDIEGVALPSHYDFPSLRFTPSELRREFKRLGWRKIVCYNSRGYIHREIQKATLDASLNNKANLLIHAIADIMQPENLEYYGRIRSCEAVMPYYPPQSTMLALLPYMETDAGVKSLLQLALISKNYGCTHYLVDSDVPDDLFEKEIKSYEDECGIKFIHLPKYHFVPEQDRYLPKSQIGKNAEIKSINQTELYDRLNEGRRIPEWFTFPEVLAEMQLAKPPRHKQGFTVFLTGLSGAGKSTIANVLFVKLLQFKDRPVTLLDGDIVRKNLSSELGFSKEHRDLNILRIGFVASEITKNGGIALCAPIAPYTAARDEVRKQVEKYGGFILIHVNTPLDICEKRDRKGLYAKARAGIVKGVTGIDDPYESPEVAELSIDTSNINPDEAVREILLYLEQQGYIKGEKLTGKTD